MINKALRCDNCGKVLAKYYFDVLGKKCLGCAKEILDDLSDYKISLYSNKDERRLKN